MKKILSLVAMAFFACQTFAQLPAGSDAPNFTATDINGRTWTLYDVLESGRPVIMDVSATWCGPCWSYHNSGALENLYLQHGPEGDGKLMVFFIEGDAATNLACLSGPTGCVGGTQGNWVAGTPYPIFDNAKIANDYDIAYFPTVYLITPDKKVSEIGQKSTAALWATAEPLVGAIPDNMAKMINFNGNSLTPEICTAQTANPTATILNLGLSPLTQATIELQWKGTVIQTKEWTGDLKPLDSESITFDAVNIAEPGEMTIVMTQTNSQTSAVSTTASYNFAPAPQLFKTSTVQLQVQTDASGKDVYWEIYDEAGNVLAKGGNEAVGINGGGQFPSGAPADPTAYGNYKVIKTDFQVPASGCFTFKIVDGVGNGFTGPGKYRFYNSTEPTVPFFVSTNGWKNSDAHNFAPSPNFVGANDVSVFAGVEVFPNPTADFLTVNFNLNEKTDVNLFVTNAIGAVVSNHAYQSFAQGLNQEKIQVSTLPAGLYFMNLRTEKGVVVKKFTKN